MNLEKCRVLVTGGEGFLGSYVRDALKLKGAVTWSTSHKGSDLRKRKEVDDALDFLRPEVVIHLAASVGGIAANEANPGKYFYDNIVMGAEVMDASRVFGVKKYVQVGTSCSYPANAPVPVKEEDLWGGPVNYNGALWGS
jgi:GDP-L-fucose synthase